MLRWTLGKSLLAADDVILDANSLLASCTFSVQAAKAHEEAVVHFWDVEHPLPRVLIDGDALVRESPVGQDRTPLTT
jgi:hypothetical protein